LSFIALKKRDSEGVEGKTTVTKLPSAAAMSSVNTAENYISAVGACIIHAFIMYCVNKINHHFGIT